MSKYLNNRYIHSLLCTVIIFMCTSVIYKQLMHFEYWLERAILFSIGWGLGIFVRTTLNVSSKEILKDKLFIAFLVILLTAFITGIVLNLENWANIVILFSLTFTISLLAN